MTTMYEGTTEQRLEGYKSLVRKWNEKISLVSRRTEAKTLDRLVRQAVAGADMIPADTRTIVDIGSGGGLPGIPLGIVRPNVDIILVERSSKKRVFLETACAASGLATWGIEDEYHSLRQDQLNRPVCYTSLGLGLFRDMAGRLWADMEAGDGLLLYAEEAVAEEIARNVSCETFSWRPLSGMQNTGISWLQK